MTSSTYSQMTLYNWEIFSEKWKNLIEFTRIVKFFRLFSIWSIWRIFPFPFTLSLLENYFIQHHKWLQKCLRNTSVCYQLRLYPCLKKHNFSKIYGKLGSIMLSLVAFPYDLKKKKYLDFHSKIWIAKKNNILAYIKNMRL